MKNKVQFQCIIRKMLRKIFTYCPTFPLEQVLLTRVTKSERNIGLGKIMSFRQLISEDFVLSKQLAEAGKPWSIVTPISIFTSGSE